jgi:hypothetical protein
MIFFIIKEQDNAQRGGENICDFNIPSTCFGQAGLLSVGTCKI